MKQATPGPWEVYDGPSHGRVFKNKRTVVAPLEGFTGSDRMAVAYCDYHTDEIAEANARLIAAAPEMLDALRAAEEWLSGWASAEPYIDVIRDAIAKATTGRPWIKAAPIVPRTIAG